MRLLAATLAHTVDSSLTCLGTEPCITSSKLNTGPEPNPPSSTTLPGSSAAMAASGARTSLTTGSQPPSAAPAPVSLAPPVAASLAPPASVAPPAMFPPIAAAAAAQQQAAAAVPRMPLPTLQGGHEDLARVCLNRLGLDPAVVAILLPFMPLVLAQILPGTTPVEEEQLLRYIMSPRPFDDLGRAGQGQIILNVCRRNAEDVARRYSAAPGPPVVPTATSALPPLVMRPRSQPLSAGPSAAGQAATAVQCMAPQDSAPQELHIHHQAAKGPGSFPASDSRAEQALQPFNPPDTSIGAAQQQSVATSVVAGMGQGGAPARAATAGLAAAALNVAVQPQQAPQQLPETGGRVVESATPPPGKVCMHHRIALYVHCRRTDAALWLRTCHLVQECPLCHQESAQPGLVLQLTYAPPMIRL